jgi:hypothetical protein
LDITTLVQSVEVNKSYIISGNDSVCISAKVENPTGITLRADIEAPDNTAIDIIQLYDDGNHNDGNAGDGLYANIWPVLSQEERHYYVDLYVTQIDEDSVSQKINDAAVFTTIGPLVLEDVTFYPQNPNPGDRVNCRLTIRNNGSNTTAKNVNAIISCLDTTFASLGTHSSPFKNIAPGAEIKSNLWYTIDIAEDFPDSTEIQFKVDISSFDDINSVVVPNPDNYILWQDTFSVFINKTGNISIETQNLPQKFELCQNYPNPFNPSTTIEYSIPKLSKVEVSVYTINGQKLETLINKNHTTGNYQVTWDGSEYASGVYIYQINADNQVQSKKMLLLK